MPATFDENLVQKLRDKEYRDAYAADVVRVGIARQIRALREQEGREWSQAELGRRMGKPQSVVSRLEDPDYGRLTLQTLFEVAAGFDLPLWVEVMDWKEFFDRSPKVLPGDLERRSFDPDRLAAAARRTQAHGDQDSLSLTTNAGRSSAFSSNEAAMAAAAYAIALAHEFPLEGEAGEKNWFESRRDPGVPSTGPFGLPSGGPLDQFTKPTIPFASNQNEPGIIAALLRR